MTLDLKTDKTDRRAGKTNSPTDRQTRCHTDTENGSQADSQTRQTASHFYRQDDRQPAR